MRVPSAAVAVKDLRPLRGAQRTRVLDRHPRCGCCLIMRSVSASLFSERTRRSNGFNLLARDHHLSYINGNPARQTGTNRTTQAEISNLWRPSFPGRVTGRNFQPLAAEFSGAGQEEAKIISIGGNFGGNLDSYVNNLSFKINNLYVVFGRR
jgi:hypothetical protein